MKKLLCLFDVSSFVHAGHVNKYTFVEDLVEVGARFRTNRTPTGGASLLFNTVLDLISTADMVMCCDRNPTIKKSILPTYKGSRSHKHDIQVDKAATEYILEKCGFTCLYAPGYEADDFIYNMVKKFYDQYEEIRVYTGDSDLYFLVDDKVSMYPSTSKSKMVTRKNYESVIKKGYHVAYNSLTMYKIIYGDSSDDIPALPASIRDTVARFVMKPEIQPHLGERKIIEYYMGLVAPSYKSQIDIVYPLEIPDLSVEIKQPHLQTILNWGSAINNKLCRGRGERAWDVTPFVKELHSMGFFVEQAD